MKTRKMDHVCPFCKAKLDRVSELGGESVNVSDGDVSICVKCGSLSMFDSSAIGGLRKPNVAEYAEISKDEKITLALQSWKDVVGKGRNQ